MSQPRVIEMHATDVRERSSEKLSNPQKRRRRLQRVAAEDAVARDREGLHARLGDIEARLASLEKPKVSHFQFDAEVTEFVPSTTMYERKSMESEDFRAQAYQKHRQVVEVPVFEGGCSEEDVKRAFDLGTKLATEEKEKITGMLMERMEEMKKTYKNDLTEAKLRKEPSDSESKEMKLKEMLKTQMHTNMELKTKLSKAEDVVKHMESEAMNLRAKIKSYEDILQKEAEETAKQKELSLMCGTEVPRDAVVLIQQRFEKEGITWDTENLQALFDCDVVQVFKEAFANFQAALESAMTGGVRSSSSSVEEDSGDESESGSYEDECFKQFEKENM